MYGSGRNRAERIERISGSLQVEKAYFNHQRRRKTTCCKRSDVIKFEQDYPAFLLALSASLRTGLDPISALQECGKSFAAGSVLGAEVRKAIMMIERGVGEDGVFSRFAEHVAHPDLPLFRSALALSRRHGSSLAPCLHRLARVTRQRQSFRRKMRAATAMQRLSAFGIAGSALTITAVQFCANPHALNDAWMHPLGRMAVICGAFLTVGGLGWMLYLTRSRV